MPAEGQDDLSSAPALGHEELGAIFRHCDALCRLILKHQHSQKHTEDKYDQENRERNIKENFGYSLGVLGNFCESKKTCNNGNDEENDGPLDHECPPSSENAVRDRRTTAVVAPFQIARKLPVQSHLLDLWTAALPPMSTTIGEIGLTECGVLGTER
jgi:hypothetical protein